MHTTTTIPSGSGGRAAAARSTAQRALCALALLSLASPLLHVRADTFLDEVCADAADVLPGLAAEDPSTFSADGCDASEPFLICDVRATGGSCASNPRCTPELTAASTCTPDTEDISCCTELRMKECPDCEPITSACSVVCPETTSSTPAAPTGTASPGDFECRALASGTLAGLATDNPESYSPGCDNGVGPAGTVAATVCDLQGRGGTCDASPQCTPEFTTNDGCPATIDENTLVCCIQVFVAPCDGCPGIPTECVQFCAPGPGAISGPGVAPSPLDAPIDSPQPATAGRGPAPSVVAPDVANTQDPEPVALPPAPESETPGAAAAPAPAEPGLAPVGTAPEQPSTAPAPLLDEDADDVAVEPTADPVDAPAATDDDPDRNVVVSGVGILDVGDVDGPAADAPVATPVPAPAQPPAPAAGADAPTAVTREFDAELPAATDVEMPAAGAGESDEQDSDVEEGNGVVNTEDSSGDVNPLDDLDAPAEILGAGDESGGDATFGGEFVCAVVASLAAARIIGF